MSAPTLSEARQEAARISRAIPEIAGRTVSARELHEKAEHARQSVIDMAAKLLRSRDMLIEALEALPLDDGAESVDLLASTKEHRREIFEKLVDVDPDHEWFWTEEWQAGERAVDRDIAAGVPMESGTPEEFLVALSKISARGA
ncbi:MAG: hypothetical protein ACRDGS_04755 [Chloroflexota bacterium]